jgi:hypothetical protein
LYYLTKNNIKEKEKDHEQNLILSAKRAFLRFLRKRQALPKWTQAEATKHLV